MDRVTGTKIRVALQIGALMLAGLIVIFFGGLLVVTRGASGHSVNTATIRIAAPREDVFAWITDPHRQIQWISGLKSSRVVEGEKLTRGTRIEQVVGSGDARMELESEVTAVEVPRTITYQIVSEAVSLDVTYALAESGDGTELHYESVAQYDPFLIRLLEPFVRARVQKKLEHDLARLRALAESP